MSDKPLDDWPYWTATGRSLIVVDQSPLIETLAQINKQIEILRKRSEGANHAGDDSLHDQFKDLSIRFTEISSSIGSDSSLRSELDNIKSSYDSRLNNLESTITKLRADNETLSRDNSDLAAKSILPLQQRIEFLERQILEMNSKSAESNSALEERVHAFETEFGKMLNRENSPSNLEKKLRDLELKMSHLDDANSMNETRLKNVEKNALNAFYMAESAKSTIESVEQSTIPRIDELITNLSNNKAEGNDLFTKADVEALGFKADSDDIVRLEEMINKMHKLLVRSSSDNKNYLDTWEKKNDNKLEFLSEWLLKRVRKEFGGGAMRPEGGGGGGPREGADIGRVRCLVCDQSIHQNKTADTIFGGPPMVPTLLTRGQTSNLPGGQRIRTGSPQQSRGPAVATATNSHDLEVPAAEQQHYSSAAKNIMESITLPHNQRDDGVSPEPAMSPRIVVKPPRVVHTSGGQATDREFVQVAQTMFPPNKEKVESRMLAVRQQSMSMPTLNGRPSSAPMKKAQGKLAAMGRSQQPLHLNSIGSSIQF